MSTRLVVTDPATRLLDVVNAPERTLTVSYSGPNTLTVSEGYLEEVSRVFGTGAITIPAVTAQFGVQGSAAITTPSVTAAGAGARIVTGTSAVSVPAITAGITGEVNGVIVGSAALTMPAVTASAAGGDAPILQSVTFTDNNDGTPATLSISYTGDVTGYRVYIATGSNSLSVSAAQLYAGSGGTAVLEYTDFATGTDVDVTGLTATSNSATRVAVALIESATGSGASNVITQTVSGLDFTAPTFSSAEVGNIGASTVEITASETLYGSPSASDFTLTGNTISAASIVGGKIRLTLGTAATSGDDYTGDLSYTQSAGSITDGDGNELANFASQNVTNNVAGGATPSVTSVTVEETQETTTTPEITVDLSAYSAGDVLIVGVVGDTATGLRYNGSSVTADSTDTSPAGNQRIRVFTYTLPGAGSVSDTVGVDLPGSVYFNRFYVAVAQDGTVSNVNGAFLQFSTASLETTSTVTSGSNAVVSFVYAESGCGTLTWTAPTFAQGAVDGVSGAFQSATATNVSTGTYTASVDGSTITGATGDEDRALMTVLIE